MTTPNQNPPHGTGRLVQIETKRESSTASNTSYPLPTMPRYTNAQVYRKKGYIFYRKLVGFLHTDHSYGAFRRWYMSKILPDKVLYRWLPYRQGECNRCGLCCKIVYRCPFYVEENELTACSIYIDEKHSPSACVVFPIDPRDIQEVQKQVAPAPCPFHFVGEPEHPTTWGALKAYWREEWDRRVEKLKEEFDF